MTIYTVTRNLDGATAEVDTASQRASAAAIFDLFNYEGNIIAWSNIASIEGAAEALVAGDLDAARGSLSDLDLRLDRPRKRVFTVIENMRRITRYEADEADLTPEQIALLDRVGDSGDEVDDEYLVDSMTNAADEGEEIAIDLADAPGFFVTDITVEGS